MGLFDFLKSKKTGPQTSTNGSYFDSTINDTDLKVLINKAISVFQDHPDFESNLIIEWIKLYTDEDLALALYRFIPIAYCRLFIPEPAYSDEYVVFKNENNQKSFSFSSDSIYNAVLKESREKLLQETSQDKIMSILFHSSDFNAINTALKHGSALKDLVCSPPYFL